MTSYFTRLAYNLFAPFLRARLNGRIAGKPLFGTSMVLYYDRGQHLGFFGRRRIYYEPETRRILEPYVIPGSMVFEIGSNIGQHTLWFAERTGAGGRVVCVEPDPENLAFLHFNTRKNRCRHVDILPWAISDKAGKSIFHRDAITGGRSGTLLDGYALPEGHSETIEVETRTYRELLRMYGQPDLVKVDVEGAEHLVFTDKALLKTSTVYFIEARKETHPAIFKIFSEGGFEAFVAGDSASRVRDHSDLTDFCNLLFVHPERQRPNGVNAQSGMIVHP